MAEKVDRKILHIIKENHNFEDKPVNDRKFLSCYASFTSWLNQYQLTTKTDYVNDLRSFIDEAKKRYVTDEGIPKMSTEILNNIESKLPDNYVYHLDDITNNQAKATPITWGYLVKLVGK